MSNWRPQQKIILLCKMGIGFSIPFQKMPPFIAVTYVVIILAYTNENSKGVPSDISNAAVGQIIATAASPAASGARGFLRFGGSDAAIDGFGLNHDLGLNQYIHLQVKTPISKRCTCCHFYFRRWTDCRHCCYCYCFRLRWIHLMFNNKYLIYPRGVSAAISTAVDREIAAAAAAATATSSRFCGFNRFGSIGLSWFGRDRRLKKNVSQTDLYNLLDSWYIYSSSAIYCQLLFIQFHFILAPFFINN